MACITGTNIVDDGLVFYYDMSNASKSWKGKPTTNLLSNVNLFNSWSKINVAITYDIEASPIVGYNAVKWEAISATNHQLYQPKNGTGTYQFSVYVKMISHRGFYLAGYNNGFAVYFDLVNAVVTSTVGSGVSGNIEYIKDGWYRCSMVVPTIAVEVHIGFLDAIYTGASSSAWAVTTVVGTSGLIACAQFEENSFVTPFVNGIRSNTEAIVDLTKNNTITATNLTYNVDGSFGLDGTSGYIGLGKSFISTGEIGSGDVSYTLEAWVRLNGTPGADYSGWSIVGNAAAAGIGLQVLSSAGIKANLGYRNTSNFNTTTSLNIGQWYHIVGTREVGVNNRLYLNGILDATLGIASLTVGNTSAEMQIGWANTRFTTNKFNGDIGIVRIYDRHLSDLEVAQNFEAERHKYNI